MVLINAEDRQRIALSWIISIATTALLLTTFFFMKLSQSTPPVSPMELFVEVNYGTSNIGSGNIQTYNKPSDSKIAENMKAGEEKIKPKASAAQPTPPSPRPEPVKPTTRVAQKPVITSKVESPVEETAKNEPKKVNSKSSSSSASTTPVPEKAMNKDALFKRSSGSASGSNGTNGTTTGVGGNNNGDDASGVGDKGAKSGSLYSKTYGRSGGGGGTAVGLDLNGWKWSRAPQVNDNSDATGEITFRIIVGSNGRVKNVIQLRSTVTDYAVINKYKDAVRVLTFVQSSNNVPEESSGTITFKIRAQ
jgi:outer membrane biosynthesis protein TonB